MNYNKRILQPLLWHKNAKHTNDMSKPTVSIPCVIPFGNTLFSKDSIRFHSEEPFFGQYLRPNKTISPRK